MEIKEQTEMARVAGWSYRRQVPQVASVHRQDVIELFKIAQSDLSRPKVVQSIPAPKRLCRGARIRSLANVPVAGATGINAEPVLVTGFADDLLEYSVGCW